MLDAHRIAISMDGRGRWRDNVVVEQLWRTVKNEVVYLHGYVSLSETRASLRSYFDFYSARKPHSALDAGTPDKVYFGSLPQSETA